VRHEPKRPAKWIGFGIGLGVDLLIVGAVLGALASGSGDMKVFEADQQGALSR
jgi:hypothetical protein